VSFFSRLFGSGTSLLKKAIEEGGLIIDVRLPHQYDQGKIRGSLNIPLEQILKNAGYLKRQNKPIIICGNGSESSQATHILQRQGLKEVYDAGSWERLLKILNS
jgi:phage shock protein E